LSRLKIALVVPGGVGSGYYEDGIPLLLRFCSEIALHCDLHVFSLTKTSDDFKPRLFMALFDRVHREQSFSLVQGIWTSPSGLMAVLAARSYGITSLVSLQGGGLADIKALKYGGNQGFLKKRLNNWILKQASWISAETNFQADLLLDKKFHNKLSVIRYGILPKDFPEAERPAFNGPIEFIHIANINVVKNQEFLIETFKSLSNKIDCRLKIIGPDFYDGKIQALVQQYNLGDLISFEGHQPFSVVQQALKQAQVMLHTSHYESTAMAVIEAMASKVLVCATDVGIVSDLGEEYFLINRNNKADSFADSICALLKNKSSVDSKVQRSFEWTRSNTLAKCATAFFDLYQKIIGTK